MTIASGLGSTLGFATESTVGTFATPTRWRTYQKESLKWKKNTVQSQALAGSLYLLGSRRAMVNWTADGSIDLELTDRGLGQLFSVMLGSSATVTQIGTTGVYQQVHSPGDTTGKSLTIQVGRPETNGTMVPFSYNGCKVTDWTLGVQNSGAGAIGTLSVSIDAWNSSTSQVYAAPTYIADNMFQFREAQLLIGGTVTTTSGVASVSGGASVLPVAKSISIKGTNAMDSARFFLGGNGSKAEQLSNGFRSITGTVDLEFENTTDVLAAFYSDAPVALQLNFTGPVVGGGQTSGLQVLIPQIRWDGDEPNVDGPGVLSYSGAFTGLWDGTNAPIQFIYDSLDSTL